MNRREMLLTAGAGALSLILPRSTVAEEASKGFTLPKLPYEYDALEPVIDKMTMTIHHTKHHQAYIDNLNKAIAGNAELQGKSIEELVANARTINPMPLRTAVINNGGGHLNHTLFWQIMAPKGQGGEPSAALAKAIENYGGMQKLKDDVLAAALGRFGSGWAWVVVGANGTLEVVSTANQNNPITGTQNRPGRKPILGIDVWEHAYYLKYQNRRADYVKAWWDVANWKAISENYEKARS
jgi:Fe-Mn family superoxide dismutase